VRRGEAIAVVTATVARSKFGRTAELVRTAHVESTQQKAVLKIVRNLAIFNSVVILAMGAFAYTYAMPWSEIIPLSPVRRMPSQLNLHRPLISPASAQSGRGWAAWPA
jgi:magnesium-transporting ATPase (P-type)